MTALTHLTGCPGTFDGGDCSCELRYRQRSAKLLLRCQLAEAVCEAVLEAKEAGHGIAPEIVRALAEWQNELSKQVAEAWVGMRQAEAKP